MVRSRLSMEASAALDDARAIRRRLVQEVEPHLLGSRLHDEEKRLSRLRMQRYRANLPEDKREQKREDNRQRARARRALQKATETDEARARRLAAQRERKASRLDRETPEHRAQRMATDRQRSATKRATQRASESPEQRERRLAEGRLRASTRRAAQRAGETPERREKRLSAMRARTAAIRAVETEEERERRLASMREYQTRRRQEHTMQPGRQLSLVLTNCWVPNAATTLSSDSSVTTAPRVTTLPVMQPRVPQQEMGVAGSAPGPAAVGSEVDTFGSHAPSLLLDDRGAGAPLRPSYPPSSHPSSLSTSPPPSEPSLVGSAATEEEVGEEVDTSAWSVGGGAVMEGDVLDQQRTSEQSDLTAGDEDYDVVYSA